jgi:hypothetical protein
MSFETDLDDLGFGVLQQRRDGTRQYTRQTNMYLRWWVTTYPDGTAELTWEFELGEYLRAKAFHVSVQDQLSLLVFPPNEVRGPADAAWLRAEIAKAEEQLRSVDLLNGT